MCPVEHTLVNTFIARGSKRNMLFLSEFISHLLVKNRACRGRNNQERTIILRRHEFLRTRIFLCCSFSLFFRLIAIIFVVLFPCLQR